MTLDKSILDFFKEWDIPENPMNLIVPTFGGKFIWADIYLDAGWRIQRNVLTDHCRLLDDNDLRRAWGNYDHCMGELKSFKEEKNFEFASDHLVLLIHGLGRHAKTMETPRDALRKEGYEAHCVNYPSTFQDVTEHADGVEELLNNIDEHITKVSFITHSLGGLVTRELLSRKSDWMKKITPHKIVMMGTPNQGARIADFMSHFKTYTTISGPSGQDVREPTASQLPPPPIPTLVIAGGRGTEAGFNPLLGEDNDGIVTVSETKLEGAEHIIIHNIHTHLMSDDRSVVKMLEFLNEG